MKSEREMPFLLRLYKYQNERFPLLKHGILISAFTFSALSYSRICRGAPDLVPLRDYLIACFFTVSLFFLLRVFDEFKDAKDDKAFRKDLPVPRGLISLKELGMVGLVVFASQLLVLVLVEPKLWLMFTMVFVYMLLMFKEFFIKTWLRARLMPYAITHMLIIPLVDILASSADWAVQGKQAPWQLLLFFALSLFNGFVLEIGRKLRIPEDEKEGVQTYSSEYGLRRAIVYWLLFLFLCYVSSVAAGWFAGYGYLYYMVLTVFFWISYVYGLVFLRKGGRKRSKGMEVLSGIWALVVYLSLGWLGYLSL